MEGTSFTWDKENRILTIHLAGRLDSVSSKELEKKIVRALEGRNMVSVVINAEKLCYLSSAGIRVIMTIRKICADMAIINVSRDIYDIFFMTGVTALLPVKRRIRQIREHSQGELISNEADGEVYYETKDLVVKLFHADIPLDEVMHRWDLSRIAVSKGIPTPIAFEVVSCKERYGIIYEQIKGRTLADLWEEQDADMHEKIKKLAALMIMLHHTKIEEGLLPETTGRILKELENGTKLSKEVKERLTMLTRSIRPKSAFIYGNLRLSNVVEQDGSLILLNPWRCGRGNPILDLQMAASAMHADGHGEFWKLFFARYTANMDPEIKRRLENTLDPEIPPWWR